jgi:transposase InsO family protein
MSSGTRPPPSTRCSSRACKHALPGKGQTDFTYFKIIRWCWYYLSTILDCYSRYIIAWKLCTNMRAEDVTNKIELALTASGCDQAVVRHKPCLLSDNGSCYISGDLAKWLEGQKMDHVRGAPFLPQTQGKIERWRQTMKNRVLLKITYCPVILSARSGLRRILQQPAIPRELEQRHTRRRLLRPRQSYT